MAKTKLQAEAAAFHSDLAWLIRDSIDGKKAGKRLCIASMEIDETITVQIMDGSRRS
jgi:hypothetical protein